MFVLKIYLFLHPLPINTDIIYGWHQERDVLTSEAGLPVELAVAVVEGAVGAAHLPPPPPPLPLSLLSLPLSTTPLGLARGALPPVEGTAGLPDAVIRDMGLRIKVDIGQSGNSVFPADAVWDAAAEHPALPAPPALDGAAHGHRVQQGRRRFLLCRRQ